MLSGEENIAPAELGDSLWLFPLLGFETVHEDSDLVVLRGNDEGKRNCPLKGSSIVVVVGFGRTMEFGVCEVRI